MTKIDSLSAAEIRLKLVSIVMSNGRNADGTMIATVEIVSQCEAIEKFIFSQAKDPLFPEEK